MEPDDTHDNAELGAFRRKADAAFVQRIAAIILFDQGMLRAEANRRYLRITKSLPGGKEVVLHGHLTWSDLYTGDSSRGDYFLIQVDINDDRDAYKYDSETYVESEMLTPRHIANRILEILSQLTDTA